MPAASALPHGREQLRQWFTDHPGYHQPMQVANALGYTGSRERMRIYNELARLARDGDIVRLESAPPPGRVRPIVTYGAPPPRTPGHGGRRDRGTVKS